MKITIDVDSLEYKKLVYCIRQYNVLYGFCNEDVNNDFIIDVAISTLANNLASQEETFAND